MGQNASQTSHQKNKYKRHEKKKNKNLDEAETVWEINLKKFETGNSLVVQWLGL